MRKKRHENKCDGVQVCSVEANDLSDLMDELKESMKRIDEFVKDEEETDETPDFEAFEDEDGEPCTIEFIDEGDECEDEWDDECDCCCGSPVHVKFCFEEDNDNKEDYSEMSNEELMDRIHEMNGKLKGILKKMIKKGKASEENEVVEDSGELSNKEKKVLVKEYRDNSMRYAALSDEIGALEFRLKELKRQKKKVMKKCCEFEDSQFFKENAEYILSSTLKYLKDSGALIGKKK